VTTPVADAANPEVVDVVFRLHSGRLPIDHAYALFHGICATLPWLADEASARVHRVHTAATGSGWVRPDASADDELHLSRRTKLKLRLPEHRVEDALALSGQAMDIAGYSLTPGDGKAIGLSPASTLLARFVVCEEQEEETDFVQRLTQTLNASGVSGATLICGRVHRIATPETDVHTRSVVVTNLDPDGAMSLQRNGIGPAGNLGCGIFIPYKHIA
jgi:CRISPR-associated protein Cas6